MNGSIYWRHAPPGDFAVIGDPVGHSWSPKMHRAAYQELGLSYRYEAIQVPGEEFDEALESLPKLGYRGLNVTLPLKQYAFRWAKSVDPASAPYCSINTLSLLDGSGTNTDAPGFLDTLKMLEIEPPGLVMMLGAGGTARALALALSTEGFKLRIWNRTPEKAFDMVRELGIEAEVLDTPVVQGARLILNTTSAGISGQPLDIPWGHPEDGSVAYDLLPTLEPTPFMKDAVLAGYRVVDGRHMLVAQGARSFEWWLGLEAPREVMLRAIS